MFWILMVVCVIVFIVVALIGAAGYFGAPDTSDERYGGGSFLDWLL